ncbi:NAD(P)-binding protein [Uliginosibacterium sediminicola]|uniref:NAD(P)-binding protein n=1 Tax=Uliginosibacterium sediminicola TaxID=2024550 RepID=A0ABU9YYB8_9RHOO
MQRREFLSALAALAGSGLSGCDRLFAHRPPVTVFRPGMQAGHSIRDAQAIPEPGESIECDVAILGSGAAGISAAWKLAREGWKNLILVEGPVPGGNTAGERLGGVACPTGAHYLPLPSMASVHIREMLASLGVIRSQPFSEKPEYDESVLVHPLHERLRIGTTWHEELLSGESDDTARFLNLIKQLRATKGVDGLRVFAVPLACSSADPRWRALDALDFRSWLQRENFHDLALHWYADYVCRDEFGAGYAHVSAWAGLHYFASRDGQASNADAGSVLTWPDGLHTLSQHLLQAVPFDNHATRRMAGSAVRVREGERKAEVIVMQGARSIRIEARRVICAMPLHVALHVVEDMAGHGFHREHLPQQSPWMVANFLLRRFPQETGDVPLAWDNVLQDSRALGYVVATHQLIRVAKPEHTVFTAYNALADEAPEAARKWMLTASDSDCLQRAAQDLLAVYGPALWREVEQVNIHLRGHAMSAPAPGFLSNTGLQALRSANGRVRFAHADLSGYSVFEEAAWWGTQQAIALLGH